MPTLDELLNSLPQKKSVDDILNSLPSNNNLPDNKALPATGGASVSSTDISSNTEGYYLGLPQTKQENNVNVLDEIGSFLTDAKTYSPGQGQSRPVPVVGEFVTIDDNKPMSNNLDLAGRGLIRGASGLLSGFAGAAKMHGHEELGTKMEGYSKWLTDYSNDIPDARKPNFYKESADKEFQYGDIVKPQYWSSGQAANDIGEAIGGSAGFIPIIGTTELIVGNAMGKLISSPLGQATAKTIFASYLNRKMESTTEAGGQFAETRDRLIQQGVSPTDAQQKAQESAQYVYDENMKLWAKDIVEFGAAFGKMPKTNFSAKLESKLGPKAGTAGNVIDNALSFGTRAGAIALPEMGEEAKQSLIGLEAEKLAGLRKEDVPGFFDFTNWPAETKRAAYLGAGGGVVMGGPAELAHRTAQKQADDMLNSLPEANATNETEQQTTLKNIAGNKYYDLAKQVSDKTGIPAEFIYGQWYHETEGFTSPLAKENNNFGGLTQSTPNGMKQPDGDMYYMNFDTPEQYADYYANYLKYYKNDGVFDAKTPEEFAAALKRGGYYGDSVENYVAGMKNGMANIGADIPISAARTPDSTSPAIVKEGAINNKIGIDEITQDEVDTIKQIAEERINTSNDPAEINFLMGAMEKGKDGIVEIGNKYGLFEQKTQDRTAVAENNNATDSATKDTTNDSGNIPNADVSKIVEAIKTGDIAYDQQNNTFSPLTSHGRYVLALNQQTQGATNNEQQPFLPVEYYTEPDKVVAKQGLIDALNSVAAQKFDQAEQQTVQAQQQRQGLVNAMNAVAAQKFDTAGQQASQLQQERNAFVNTLVQMGRDTVDKRQQLLSALGQVAGQKFDAATEKSMFRRQLADAVQRKDYATAANIAIQMGNPIRAKSYAQYALQNAPQEVSQGFMPTEYYDNREKLQGKQTLIDTIAAIAGKKFDAAEQQSMGSALQREYESLDDFEKLFVDLIHSYNTPIEMVSVELQNSRNKMINEYLAVLRGQMKQGYEKGGVTQRTDPNGEKNGDNFAVGSVSLNYQWYKDALVFYKQSTGKPYKETQKDNPEWEYILHETAVDHLRNGYTDANFGIMVEEATTELFNDLEGAINGVQEIKSKISGAVRQDLRGNVTGGTSNVGDIQSAAQDARNLFSAYRNSQEVANSPVESEQPAQPPELANRIARLRQQPTQIQQPGMRPEVAAAIERRKQERLTQENTNQDAAPENNLEPVTGEPATAKINKSKNSVEISFAQEPSDAAVQELEAKGFKYSTGAKVYYAKYSPETWGYAKDFAGRQTKQDAPVITPANNPINEVFSKLPEYEITQTKHTKTGADIFVVKLKKRMGKDEFDAIRANMKRIGGSWSTFTKGFNFSVDPRPSISQRQAAKSAAGPANQKLVDKITSWSDEELQRRHQFLLENDNGDNTLTDAVRTEIDKRKKQTDNKTAGAEVAKMSDNDLRAVLERAIKEKDIETNNVAREEMTKRSKGTVKKGDHVEWFDGENRRQGEVIDVSDTGFSTPDYSGMWSQWFYNGFSVIENPKSKTNNIKDRIIIGTIPDNTTNDNHEMNTVGAGGFDGSQANRDKLRNKLLEKIGKKPIEKKINIVDDSDAALEAALANLNNKLNKLSSTPFDPELMGAAFKVGAIYLQRGSNTLASWTDKMITAVGENIRPFLPSTWTAINSWPDDVKYDDDTANTLFEYVGVLYQDGVTSKEEIAKKIQEDIGEEYLNLVDSVYNGIKEWPGFKEQSTKTEQGSEYAVATGNVADFVQNKLQNGSSFTYQELFDTADNAFGGTQADGKYTPKDAYDAMELGINKYIQQQAEITPSVKTAEEAGRVVQRILDSILTKIPTQTKRTAEQDEFQQFSTPPNIAYIAAWVADITTNDAVLEPSAGIGGLAVFADKVANTVIVNELSKRRLDIIKQMGFDQVFNENAEQINNILPASVKPTVVIMNPPFSSTAGRTQGKNNNLNVIPHVEQALKRLEPGGRLVAIVGRGMSEDAATFRDWWKRTKEQYNVRANIGIDGKNYAKYGTSFDVQLLVIDKTGTTTGATVTNNFTGLSDVLMALEGIRNDRIRTVSRNEQTEQDARTEQNSENMAGEGGSTTGRDGRADGVPTNQVGTGEQGSVRGGQSGNEGTSGTGRGSRGAGNTRNGAGNTANSGRRAGENVAGSVGTKEPDNAGGRGMEDDRQAGYGDKKTITVETKVNDVIDKELSDAVYEGYVPEKLHVPGAIKHPSDLVQSSAMAAVSPPDVTYTPNLPAKIITDGVLSDAQLEAVVYAGQAHESILPDGRRKGFFIGDGTGLGKGREIAGIILDNLRQGRKKAVWISKNQDLFVDAKRDVAAVIGNSDMIFQHGKIKKDSEIQGDEGILFTTYDTVKSGLELSSEEIKNKKGEAARIDQIVNWLGKDFDGVIAFDEAHMMQNCMSMKTKRGKSKPALMALAGVELQRRLPKARVIYVSATGATEVRNLGYADRLGLWGEGTPFAKASDFVSEVDSGGVSAMELIARDMKAMGLYIARSLSFDGVTYGTLEHELSETQRDIYNTLARAWQSVLQNIQEALAATNGAKNSNARKNAAGQFWSSQQRFFNQVITSLQMPSVLEDIKKQVAEGNSVVLQLVNTNEASQNREIANKQAEGASLDEIDLTPREMLMRYLEKSFPVQQYEIYLDDKGNEVSRPVTNSRGEPVLNMEAVRLRDRLLEEVGSVRIPEGPLEMLLNTFGADKVAEITGRQRRVVRVKDKTGKEKTVVERRSNTAVEADVNAFMDDKKQILIFSDAGGTGKSYHADKTKKNQRKRIHYLVQPGWRADSAVQGFGRTHRSNEAQPPHYVLVTTNLKGQKRFISSIARRLDQLGALTKGERQTGSQGIFNAKDNLEGFYAMDALDSFYENLARNRISGLNGIDTLIKMGLVKRDPLTNKLSGIVNEQGNIKDDSATRDVPKFLNRLLSLEDTLQEKVFSAFFAQMEELIDRAAARGELDTGLEIFRADTVKEKQTKEVYTHESGAKTIYHEIEAGHKVKKLTHDAAQELSGFIGFFKNDRSGNVWVARKGPQKTKINGDVVDTYYLHGAKADANRRVESDEFSPDRRGWTKLEGDDAKNAWQDTLDKQDNIETEKLHIISGVILPVWDRFPSGFSRVMKLKTDEGKIVLGKEIADRDIDATLSRLGAERDREQLTPQQYVDLIMRGGEVELANGWSIARRRVSGENRIEIIGRDMYPVRDSLERNGVFVERIQFTTRFFIPNGETAARVFEAVTQYRPVVNTNQPNRNNNTLNSGFDPTFGKFDDVDIQAVLKPYVKKAAEAIPKLSRLGQHLVDKGITTGKEWMAEMRRTLGDMWDSFRPVIGKVWTQVREYIKNERGSVRLGGGDKPIDKLAQKAISDTERFIENTTIEVLNDNGIQTHEFLPATDGRTTTAGQDREGILQGNERTGRNTGENVLSAGNKQDNGRRGTGGDVAVSTNDLQTRGSNNTVRLGKPGVQRGFAQGTNTERNDRREDRRNQRDISISKTVGLNVISNSVNDGNTSLVGTKINNVHELAVSAQTLRHPGYEKAQFVYVKNGNVIHHETYTNYLPTKFNMLLPGETTKQLTERIVSVMERVGAEEFYIIHNHPSGDPTPSRADENISDFLSNNIRGFGGHIVLDHKQYSLVFGVNETEYYDIPKPTKDYIDAEIPHPSLGRKVEDHSTLAEMAQYARTNPGFSVVFYLDKDDFVRGVQEVNNAVFDKQNVATRYLRWSARAHYGSKVMIATDNKAVFDTAKELTTKNHVANAMLLTGQEFALNQVQVQSDGTWIGQKQSGGTLQLQENETQVTYYRYTNKKSPMSDWGHAMFAEDQEAVKNYGKEMYTYDGTNAVNIDDLTDKIAEEWKKSQETGDFGRMLSDEYYQGLNVEDVVESFNPTDIVNSADGYDSDLVLWLWEKVLEPNNISAVITTDGAVVFDEELIKKHSVKPGAQGNIADQTQLPAFKKWFGNSKVVDANGKPLVVYHGSPNEFFNFDTSRSNGMIWLTGNKKYANEFTEGNEPLTLFASIKNPINAKRLTGEHKLYYWKNKLQALSVDINSIDWDKIDFAPDYGKYYWYDLFPHAGNNYQDAGVVDAIKKAGYDGMITPLEEVNGVKSKNTFVAFEPTQIKSATDNIGTYDGTSPDIRYSIEQLIDEGAINPVTRNALRKAFPDAEVRQTDKNIFVVKLPNGRIITVGTEWNITFDRAAAEEAYKDIFPDGIPNNAVPTGKFVPLGLDGFIELSKLGDSATLNHEQLHAAWYMALTDREIGVLIKRYGSEESAAFAYEDWRAGRGDVKPSGLIGRLFQKIKDFITATRDAIIRDEKAVFRAIENGDVWKRTGRNSVSETTGRNEEVLKDSQGVKYRIEQPGRESDANTDSSFISGNVEQSTMNLAQKIGIQPVDNVTIIERDTRDKIGPFNRYIRSVAPMVKKYPKLQPFFMMATKAMEKQEQLRNDFYHRLNKINKLVSNKQDKADLFKVLLDGDMQQHTFSKEELQELGYNDKVVSAYRMVRTAFDHAYKLVNEVSQGMEYKSKTISSDALESLKANPFVDIKTIDKNEDGYLVTWQQPKMFKRVVTMTQADLDELRKNENVHVTSVKRHENADELANGDDWLDVEYMQKKNDIHYREGYVPHFFHDWFVVAKNGDKYEMIGSARTPRKATEIANKYAVDNPDVEVIIKPKQFQFPDESVNAAIMGDLDYANMVRKVSDDLSISLKDAREFMDGKAHMRNRHRFLGSLLQRKGANGWEMDLDWVMSHHFNQVSRYVALDPFKSKSISMFERLFGQFDKEHRDLAGYVKEYINDVNGVPTKIEDAFNTALNESEWFKKFLGSHFTDRPVLEITSHVTNVVSVAKLGMLNVSSALLQLTQLNNVYAALNSEKWFGIGFAHAVHMNLQDKVILRRCNVDANLSMETGGYSKAGQMGNMFKSTTVLFRTGDIFVRRVAVLGAYRKAIAEGKNQAEATNYAKEVNRRANFDYGVNDAPNIFRRGGPISQMALQFKKYPIKQLELMGEIAFHGSKGNIARMFIPFLLMSGFWGIPFFGLFKDILGWFGDEDKEMAWKKHLMEWAGDDKAKQAIAKTAWYGALANAGVDISKRAGIGDFGTTQLPKSVMEAIGVAFGPTGSTVIQAIQQASQGNVNETLKAISPGVGNIAVAIAGETHGKRGRVNTKYDEVMERVAKGLGFMPIDESVERDVARIKQVTEKEQQKKEQEAIDKYISAYKSGKQDKIQEAAKELQRLRITPARIRNEMVNKDKTNAQRTTEGMSKQNRSEYLQLDKFAK